MDNFVDFGIMLKAVNKFLIAIPFQFSSVFLAGRVVWSR